MSDFDGYVDLRGRRTLRTFSRPVNRARFERMHLGWMTSDKAPWWIPEYLVDIPHTRLLTPAMARALTRADRRPVEAALVGSRTR